MVSPMLYGLYSAVLVFVGFVLICACAAVYVYDDLFIYFVSPRFSTQHRTFRFAMFTAGAVLVWAALELGPRWDYLATGSLLAVALMTITIRTLGAVPDIENALGD